MPIRETLDGSLCWFLGLLGFWCRVPWEQQAVPVWQFDFNQNKRICYLYKDLFYNFILYGRGTFINTDILVRLWFCVSANHSKCCVVAPDLEKGLSCCSHSANMEKASFSADVLTRHNWKNAGVPDGIVKVSVIFSLHSKLQQCERVPGCTIPECQRGTLSHGQFYSFFLLVLFFSPPPALTRFKPMGNHCSRWWDGQFRYPRQVKEDIAEPRGDSVALFKLPLMFLLLTALSHVNVSARTP